MTAETEGRVYNVAGADWEEVVAAADAGDSRARSAWSSTWGRSIRPRTACSG